MARGAARPEQPAYEEAIQTLVEGVREGLAVVPLTGAGISIESGVPPLSEVTRYLAKVKAYLRYRVFTNRRSERGSDDLIKAVLQEPLGKPPFGTQPHYFLREFGWPDPHQLNSSLWHALWREDPPAQFSHMLNLLIDKEILESLWRIDGGLARQVEEVRKANPYDQRALTGSYWRGLLTQLTRSSPDLIDTMFQRLTYNRAPSVAHRYLAFLAPVLRLRLFLTINFDTLIEDALRVEGFRPTVYEVAEGLKLPDPKLVQEGLSVVKLHGGAYGLMVGEKLDSPLDAETRARFSAYLPENLVLLVMGIGGWDQRVLDMVELTHERQGSVWWLHFEPNPPDALADRFSERPSKENPGGGLPEWLHTARVRDPGAFLREMFTRFKHSHPSSSCPLQVCDLRPVVPDTEAEAKAAIVRGQKAVGSVRTGKDGRLIVYEDLPNDHGLGASLRLARFVAAKASTHLPLWIDLETKFDVQDLIVEVIQQLRRYDPGLPPEILVLERSSMGGSSNRFRKVVRRLYAALARGRYVLAFSGVEAFGRVPTRHHFEVDLAPDPHREREDLHALLSTLIECIDTPQKLGRFHWPENLGLLDSILAFGIDPEGDSATRKPVTGLLRDHTDEAAGNAGDRLNSSLATPPETLAVIEGWGNPPIALADIKLLERPWYDEPALTVVSAVRRRRSAVVFHRLLPRYLRLPKLGPHASEEEGRRDTEDVDATIERWTRAPHPLLWRLEGGDYWMSRRLRNAFYSRVRNVAHPAHAAGIAAVERVRALTFLAFVHQDVAEYYHRDIYVGTQDVSSFLEELYHRMSSLRHLLALAALAGTTLADAADRAWIEELSRPLFAAPTGEDKEPTWSGLRPLVVDQRLDLDGLAHRVFRSLRTLREVLLQEREGLLARVPSVTLQGWIASLRGELNVQDLSPGSPLAPELSNESAALAELLNDIEVDVLQDRMIAGAIIERRHADLVELIEQAAPGTGGEPADDNKELIWLDANGRKQAGGPRRGQLIEMCGADRPAGASGDSAAVRRVVQALIDISRALRRSTWEPALAHDAARRFTALVDEILCRAEDPLAAGGGPVRHMPISTELLNLRVRHLRLAADEAIWGHTPWATRGKGAAARESQEAAATRTANLCDQALQILDSIYEADRTARSYFYSLKGRAIYLTHAARADGFQQAYWQFDLARAGLSEASTGEREALAVTLLRQAECLMVHSGAAFLDEVYRHNERPPADGACVSCMSSEGLRRLNLAGNARSPDEEADHLLQLSLANWKPEILARFEYAPQNRSKVVGILGAMRSQLSAARDLLDRVEALLEANGSNVEWWACLFQLQAQWAVERLLLLISGDVALGAGAAVPARGEAGERAADQDGAADAHFGRPGGAPLRRTAAGPAANPLVMDGALRRRFIHGFQGFLREGVMAVRRGLDILLPDDTERNHTGRIENDVLLNRLLQSWTELMVCGAAATEISQVNSPGDDDDANVREAVLSDIGQERWDQWRYLNWLAGLVALPRCVEVRNWFIDRSWNVGHYPPGLAARAQTLARMALSLVESSAVTIDSRTVPMPGGDAIRHLQEALRSRVQGYPPDALSGTASGPAAGASTAAVSGAPALPDQER